MRPGRVKAMVLKLKCPRCGKVAEYAGYPSDPVLSTVLCLHCRYAGSGATFEHLHPEGERCSKDIEIRL